MDKILIIKHGAFGDLVQADGSFRAIRQHFKHAHITLLTSPVYQSLMQRCPHIDAIITDPRASLWNIPKTIKLYQQVSQSSFSQIIDLQNSDRTRFYRRFLFTNTPWIARCSGLSPSSGLSGQMTLLANAGIAHEAVMKPDISWMADDVTELLQSSGIHQPYIVLIPGSSAQHRQKRWPYFAELAKRLIDQQYQVVNLTGPDEQELAKNLAGHHLKPNGQFLSWFQIAGLLKQAAFVIGNDTGPSHVASCIGTPGFALFGPTSAARAEITRGAFGAIQVKDLAALPLRTVLAELNSKWPNSTPPPTTLAPLSNYSTHLYRQ